MSRVRATARLQLHAGFTLDDATGQVDYYAALGISHLYLSPIWRAVPGSTHGYDVVDPGVVNPELGGEAALRALSAAARAHGMGLVLDIVPNHMAAHADNRWWWDVLSHGRGSDYAHWFDIQWHAPLAHGRLLLPVLDRPLQAALEQGALQIDRGDGAPTLLHHDTRLPLAPGSDPSGADLHAVLDGQAYQPIWWRLGDDRINYRRFFTITSLVGLQVQHPDVFEAVHRLPLALLAEGVIDGLRVDHVDGLADPQAYLLRLREAMDAAGSGRERPALLWVEKILAPDEALPPEWPCDGTTGYDFMDQVGAWLHHPAGETVLAQQWHERSGRPARFSSEERLARQDVLEGGLRSESDALLRLLLGIERRSVAAPARYGRAVMARALAALLVRFPVYRSYATDHATRVADRAHWDTALDGLAREERADTVLAAQWIATRFWAEETDGRARVGQARLRRRFQQLSAPLNAKAVEDRAFYRYGVLLSRNEVGSRPDHFALSSRALHTRALMRARTHPQAMLATATHDHKRGEDSRARLAVLSEQPRWWLRQTRALERSAQRIGLALPPPAVLAMLWQTLLGAWPTQGLDDAGAFAGRIVAWQRKALREGDLWSSWTDPDHAFEARQEAFIRGLLTHPAAAPVRRTLDQAVQHVAAAGARNALAQLTLRLTLPGVPDLYQGTEGWDLSLVDPDNRRPVDYARRRAWLHDPRPWPQLLAQWQDGVVKARLLQLLLAVRRTDPALFAEGDYHPLHADREVQMLAFLRSTPTARLLVAVAHHSGAQPARQGAALSDAHWRGATLAVPRGRYRNLLTGAVLTSDGSPTRLRQLFDGSPVAIYTTW